MGRPKINVNSEEIAAFCRRNRIRRLAFFGSVLRDDFAEDSDVDVLVEFEDDADVSLLDMVRLELELGRIVGRKVDLKTPRDLSPYFRHRVLREAAVEYVAD